MAVSSRAEKRLKNISRSLQETVYPRFAEIKAKAIRDQLLEAKLVYGYFPCQSSGNDLIIYEDDEKTERLRFTFPRQPLEQRGGKNLCLADYFASGRDPGKARCRCVSTRDDGPKGQRALGKAFQVRQLHRLSAFHGLSVESAEALAEMWHKRIREELGIAGNDAPELAKLFHQGYQGSRYQFWLPGMSES